MKDNSHTRGKYLQNTYLIKNLNTENKKNSYNPRAQIMQ